MSLKSVFVFLVLSASLLGCSRFPLPPLLPATLFPSATTPSITAPSPFPSTLSPDPRIHDILLNTSDYPGNQVPRYQKLEITFQVDTTASNPQLPYDPAPPPGVTPGVGVSVDAFFTPDNWQTVFQQPAFYYQEFDDQVKRGQEWIYPRGDFTWKVRFSPHLPGRWQVRLEANDALGQAKTTPISFTVSNSGEKGFVRVSSSDRRYFELEDGSYFPALGYNMNSDHVSWNNPVLDNQANFQIMGENGIQLVRLWLSQWGIYGPSWNPWNAIDPKLHSLPIPYTGLTFNQAFPGSDVSLMLEATKNPCMMIGFLKNRLAVLPDTQYRVRIRYRTENLAGPRTAGTSFGFVAKTGDWLWDPNKKCQDAGSGLPVTPYQPQNTSDWEILEGGLKTGNEDFLPYFYLALENATEGRVFIDTVWIEEDLGDGRYGPNIVSKPWMAHHLYFEQRNSYAFDKVLALAEEKDVYFRLVVMEKNDWIFNRLDELGQPIPYDPACEDPDPGNDPLRCPGNQWFYGNGRAMNRVRWLQQSWWRYLQARWGYSTHIHSWELLNEGDPASDRHFMLADEFGKYMHQFSPNDHLVSTSTWHSFPKQEFWANPDYPNLDFSDIHQYIQEEDAEFTDSVSASLELSLLIGAKQPGGSGKPVIRGETGFVVSGTGPASKRILADEDGVWLHNFIWAGINPGGLIESYWYETAHIYSIRPNGNANFDHRPIFKPFYNFIHEIPLNNGQYEDAQVSTSPELRVLGQKDRLSGRAHLWIQNIRHTWKNIVDDIPIPAVSGKIKIDGFQANQDYLLTWWDTEQSDPAQQILGEQILTASGNGTLEISISNLTTDIAVKISPTQLER